MTAAIPRTTNKTRPRDAGCFFNHSTSATGGAAAATCDAGTSTALLDESVGGGGFPRSFSLTAADASTLVNWGVWSAS